MIFLNTHTAIIDRETFELVQRLRSNRRRPTKTGITSPFSGLMHCADCGCKLYFRYPGKGKKAGPSFFCSTYGQDSKACSAHFIREKVVEELVLESIQRVLLNVQIFENAFVRKQLDCYSEEKKKELAEKRKRLNRFRKRIEEIDLLIQRLYEDNAKGKISDDRYATLSLFYENE